jgi:uncharacterized protein (TIGR03067 family)
LTPGEQIFSTGADPGKSCQDEGSFLPAIAQYLGDLAHPARQEQHPSPSGTPASAKAHRRPVGAKSAATRAKRSGTGFADWVGKERRVQARHGFIFWEVAMRWCTVLILLAPLGVVCGAPPEDAVKNELRQFQGPWKAIAIQQADGRQAPAEEVQYTRLAVEGNKFVLTGKGYTIPGTFTIDPTKSPRAIDVTITPKEGRPLKFLGIYQMKGDTRKSCFALPGRERPTQFSAEKGFIGFEWKRD